MSAVTVIEVSAPHDRFDERAGRARNRAAGRAVILDPHRDGEIVLRYLTAAGGEPRDDEHIPCRVFYAACAAEHQPAVKRAIKQAFDGTADIINV